MGAALMKLCGRAWGHDQKVSELAYNEFAQ